MNLKLERKDWIFGLLWAGAVFGAYLLTILIGMVFSGIPVPFQYIYILLLAIFQWLLLRERLKNAYWWIAVTFAGMLIGLQLWPWISFNYLEIMPESISGSRYHFEAYMLTGALARALPLAAAQFLMLLGKTRKAGWWLLGLLLSEIAMTLVSIPVYQRMVSSSLPTDTPLLPGPVQLSLGAALGGLVAGAFMMWIFKTPEEPAPELSEIG